MTYPYNVGVQALSEKDMELYKNEEHEYLVAVMRRPESRTFCGTKEVLVTLLGAVDITEGRQFPQREFATWTVTAEEDKTPPNEWPHLRYYSFYLEEHKIYRVKGLPAKDGAPASAGLFKFRSILSDNEHDSMLEGLMAEYYKSVVYDSPVLGQMVYTDKTGEYEGEFNWLGTKIKLTAEAEPDYVDEIMPALEDICKNSVEWDRKFRAAVGDQLTYLANNWLSDQGKPGISEEEFAARQVMHSIEIGETIFVVWYEDEEIFGGHSVKIYGEIETGEVKAVMEG